MQWVSSTEQVPSADTFFFFFFLVKMWRVRVSRMLKPMTTEVWLCYIYIFTAPLQLVHKIHKGRDFSLFCSLLYPRSQNNARHIVGVLKILAERVKAGSQYKFLLVGAGEQDKLLLNSGYLSDAFPAASTLLYVFCIWEFKCMAFS